MCFWRLILLLSTWVNYSSSESKSFQPCTDITYTMAELENELDCHLPFVVFQHIIFYTSPWFPEGSPSSLDHLRENLKDVFHEITICVTVIAMFSAVIIIVVTFFTVFIINPYQSYANQV